MHIYIIHIKCQARLPIALLIKSFNPHNNPYLAYWTEKKQNEVQRN